MPDDFQMLTVEFTGRLETPTRPRPVQTYGSPPLEPKSADEEAVEILNGQADSIARDIEREVKRLFPSAQGVQADIRFAATNSIELLGSITVFSWLAPIVSAAISEVFKDGLKRVIAGAIRRALQRPLAMFGALIQSFRDLDVTLQIFSSAPPPSPPPPPSSLLERMQRSTVMSGIPFFLGLNAVLLFILLITQIIFFTLLVSRTTVWQRRFSEHLTVEIVMADRTQARLTDAPRGPCTADYAADARPNSACTAPPRPDHG
jgi:hypothetical protein